MATAFQEDAFQAEPLAFQIEGQGQVSTVQPSGGIPYRGHETRRRTKEEVQREREKLGILPRTARIIDDVAARQALDLRQDEQQRFEELQRELALEKIEWEGRYLEILNAKRQALIDEEIKALWERKRLDEENTMILLVMAATA